MKDKKMAKGGEVGDGTMKDHPTLTALRQILSQPSASGPELKGLHDMMAKASGQGEEPEVSKTDPAKEQIGMSDGGDPMQYLQGAAEKTAMPADAANAASLGLLGQQPPADGSVDLSQLPQNGGASGSWAPTPPMGQVLKQAQTTPPTNYDFYGDVNSDKVAALYKQLLAQKASGGNLLASGAAGLGDAIANSFGHGGAHAMQNVQDIQNQNVTDRMGAANQQRTQKVQDMQANSEQALNDPNSPISQSMRALFQKQGIKVPSGMPGTLMMKLAPDLGDLALKQATLQSTNAFHGAELGLRQGELGERQAAEKEKENEDRANHWILNAAGAYPGHQQSGASSGGFKYVGKVS